MILSATIKLADETLLAVSVGTAFDATSIEVGNAMRGAILDATSWDRHDERFDQFLIATAASDWARATFRAKRDATATVPCSQGRPCDTIPFPPEHTGRLIDGEPFVTLNATADDPDRSARMRTEAIAA